MCPVTIDLPPSPTCIRCGAERDALDSTLLFEGTRTMLLQARTPCPCGERRCRIEIGADIEESSPSTKDVRRVPTSNSHSH
jgi:hypothetical protein